MVLAAGNKVWIPATGPEAEEDPYELAEVLDTNPLKCFTGEGEAGHFVTPKEDEVFLANSKTETDNTSLLMISDATLLANTRERFVRDEIYTFTASIVTSVNPCKPLPHLYDEAAMARSLEDRHHTKLPEPHLFHTAESAYETLLGGGRDQSIVVSGISGAGKTEAIKYIMRYLVWRSAAAGGGVSQKLSELVMASNPVFEALGNATTVNNPNSSRFGKFIRLRFEGGKVQGSLIDTYLLEKSRLSSQQDGERNFHLFYQILAGGADDTLAALSLRRSGPFNLLGGGKPPFAYVGVEGHKKPRKEGEEVPPDPTPTMVQAKMAEEFAETVAAMQQLGIDVASAAKTIGGLLHLGNISFEVFQPPGQKVEGCKVTDASSEALETAAGLLGLSTLPFVLTRRSVQAGGGRRSMYDSPLTKKEANYTRDALAKKLYEGLFDYTVRSINNVLGGSHLAALKREPTVEEKSAMPSAGWIGLLDVFGFEIFHRNGFEQLMVNLANERLQRFFLEGIFQREQDEYKMEELPWVPIVDVPDNTDCINTIESKPFGVLPLLDEQCRLGDRGSDGTLCETLNQRNPAAAAAVEALGQKGRRLFRPDETFTIRHFVQPVTYHAAEFLERNKDIFYHDLARAVAGSSNPFVKSLIDPSKVQTDQDVAMGGSGKSYNTVAISFTTSLAGLLEELRRTDSGFVRCIKPNAPLTPNYFHATMALHQLRTCGMVQAVKMMMAMYGARFPYVDIVSSWTQGKSYLPAPLASLPPKELVMKLCRVFDVPIHEYAFGKTKLFFRAGKAVGLSAFCREALTAAEATMRSIVLLWKLKMQMRELAAAKKIATWLSRVRTKMHGTAYTNEKMRLYVVSEAKIAAETAGGGLTATGIVNESTAIFDQYVEAMALRYRVVRRGYAVKCVQDRAATRIQKMWRAKMGRKATADWRAKLERDRIEAARLAELKKQADYEAWLKIAIPAAIVIQAAWRGCGPFRYRKAAVAASLLVQCSWRMSRIRRLHMRLMQAISFLKKGGILSKYRANHIIGERHNRYVRLTPDLETMQWLPPGKGPDMEPDAEEKAKEIPMNDIQAVTDGAKTGVMKRMFQREQAGGSVFEKMLGLKPYELELKCAFSIIIKDRTIDFVAPSPEARNNWLQHLNILLVHQRTHDTEKVMTRKDVRHEMHLMSFQIGKLNKQAAKAKSRVRRASMHMGADKKAVARMSMIQSLRSTTGSTMSDKL